MKMVCFCEKVHFRFFYIYHPHIKKYLGEIENPKHFTIFANKSIK